MPRIPAIESRDQLAAEYHAVFDAIAASRGQVAGPFSMLLHSPEVAFRTADLGAYLRFEGILDEATKETTVLATARELGCAYEWAAHAPLGRKAGLSDAVIEGIKNRDPNLPEETAALVSYAQQLVRTHSADAALMAGLQSRLGVQALVELTATVGYYILLGTVLNAFDVEPPVGSDLLPRA